MNKIQKNRNIGFIKKVSDPDYNFNLIDMYVADNTLNGYCYKNYDTFENNLDDVCYIAECAFNYEILFGDYIAENKEQLINEGEISTHNSIKEEIKSCLEFDEYFYEYFQNGTVYTIEARDFDDELIESIAKTVIEEVDWQTTQAYIAENDWGDDINEYYNKKIKSYNEMEM
jgi:hypothetical protein